jgi:hypothetical protein
MGMGRRSEVRIAAAVGRCLLGGFLGFVIWFLMLLPGYEEWLFSLWVVAGFVVAGVVAGLLLGDRFLDSFAGR